MTARILHLLSVVEPTRTTPCPGLRPSTLEPARSARDVSDADAMACAALISLTRDFDHTVVLLGGTDCERRARRLGVLSTDRLCPPLGIARLARRSLRRLFRSRGPFDAMSVWGRAAEQAAVDIDPDDAARIIAAPTGMDRVALASWWARSIVAGDPRRTDRRSRRRTRLGIPSGAEVVVLLADPPGTGDARWFAQVCGLLDKSGRSIAAVMPDGVRFVDRARTMVRGAGLAFPMLRVDRASYELLSIADLAIVSTRGLNANHRVETLVPRVARDELADARSIARGSEDCLTACSQASGVDTIVVDGSVGFGGADIAPESRVRAAESERFEESSDPNPAPATSIGGASRIVRATLSPAQVASHAIALLSSARERLNGPPSDLERESHNAGPAEIDARSAAERWAASVEAWNRRTTPTASMPATIDR